MDSRVRRPGGHFKGPPAGLQHTVQCVVVGLLDVLLDDPEVAGGHVDGFVPEEGLDDADVRAVPEHVDGEGVTEHMGVDVPPEDLPEPAE